MEVIDEEQDLDVLKARSIAEIQKRKAENAFENGDCELALQCYSAVIQASRETADEYLYGVAAACELNIVAIMVSLNRWSDASTRCKQLRHDGKKYLTDAQRIKLHYFKAICNLKLKHLKESREDVNELYRLVRRSHERTPDNDISSYKQLEEALCRLESQYVISKIALIAQNISNGDPYTARDIANAVKEEMLSVQSPYDYYLDIYHARAFATIGDIDETHRLYSLTSKRRDVTALEKHLLLTTSALILSLSKNESHQEEANSFFGKIANSQWNGVAFAGVNRELELNIKACCTLKYTEHLMKSGNNLTLDAIQNLWDIIYNMHPIVFSNGICIDEGGALMPAVNCDCFHCCIGDNLKRFVKSSQTERDICCTLSMCGWREFSIYNSDIYISAVLSLWEIGSIQSSGDSAVDKMRVVGMVREILDGYKLPPTIFSEEKTRHVTLRDLYDMQQKRILNYISLQTISVSNMVTAPLGSKEYTDYPYTSMINGIDRLCNSISEFTISLTRSLTLKNNPDNLIVNDCSYKRLISGSSPLDKFVSLIFSLCDSMLNALEIRPFVLIKKKPEGPLSRRSMFHPHCLSEDDAFEAIWNDSILLLSRTINVIEAFVGVLYEAIFVDDESGGVLMRPSPQDTDKYTQKHIVRIERTFDTIYSSAMVTLVKLNYYYGLSQWHHEDGGTDIAVRAFDRALETASKLNRAKICCTEKNIIVSSVLDRDRYLNIMTADVKLHLAQVMYTKSDSKAAEFCVESAIALYTKNAPEDKLRLKHAWTLKCFVCGMLGNAVSVNLCLNEISRFVVAPLEDPIAEINGLKRDLCKRYPGLLPEERQFTKTTQASDSAESLFSKRKGNKSNSNLTDYLISTIEKKKMNTSLYQQLTDFFCNSDMNLLFSYFILGTFLALIGAVCFSVLTA